MKVPYRPRWPLLITLIGGVGALIALATFASEPEGVSLPARGGTYVEGVAGAPVRINPLFAGFNQVDQDLTSLVFSGLVRLGPTGDVQPDLAESWKVTPDGLSYVFTLRSGLLWHDGTPLDAGDVVFTVRTIQAPEFQGDPVLADLFADVTVEAQDDRTVIMTLPEPFAPLLASGATVGILPEHLLRGLDATELFNAPFNQHPIGSGPFRLTELTTAGATLRAFEAYHLGRPFLDRFELRFYRDDAALLNALIEEQIDGALLGPGLDADEVTFFDGDARWLRRPLHTTEYSLVYLNGRLPAFGEQAVRRALQVGLDRQGLIDGVLGGQALPIDSPIAPDVWAYSGDAAAYRFDPARAEALLGEAGWLRTEAGREKDGELLRFTLASSDDPVQRALAQEIARQWSGLGIQVEVAVSPAGDFVEGVLVPRQFDAALSSIRPPTADPDPYPFWHSSQVLGEGRNLAGFSHPDADRLLEHARQAPSAAERASDYRAFQQLFAQQAPAVLLATPTYQYVVRAEVQGLRPGVLFTLSARFHDVQRWFRETESMADGGD